MEEKSFHYSESAREGWGETAWKAAISLTEKQLSGKEADIRAQKSTVFYLPSKKLTLGRTEDKK